MSNASRRYKAECKQDNRDNMFRQEYFSNGAINPYKIIQRKQMSIKYYRKLNKDYTRFLRFFRNIYKNNERNYE